ncbi:S8 family serine peptidase [Mesomycoplasma neurolyticum]|uniref:Subtilase family n=1 Tax=Mesomycoplasma neurolyticum TaxID=2120 RepID=A0A449A5U4_9BACT|nr:S8 family serine peptidase [Mesomycoplasma neurolyticum]VEU59608.1 Subtilase family [Mesomycoplasma neurolyticum]
MKKKKILKSFFLAMSLGLFVFSNIPYTKQNIEVVNLQKHISQNFNHSKVIERTVSFDVPQNDNYLETSKRINGIKELKLLLNYDIEEFETHSETKTFFETQNNNFSKLFKEKFSFIKNIEISSLTPTIWIYFNNDEDKNKFINLAKEDNFIFKIINLKYEIKPLYKVPLLCMDVECLLRTDQTPEEFNEALKNHPTISPRSNTVKSPDWNKISKLKIVEDYPVEFIETNLDKIDFSMVDIKTPWKPNEHNKIGILEVENGVIYKELDQDILYDPKVYGGNNNIKDSHAGIVAKIAAGYDGVDRYAEIYSAGFASTDSLWQKQIEWMIENGVKVINHSYGPRTHSKENIYNEEAFFLDYIARKYGIINVFAAGNDHDKPNKNKYIDKTKLSFNLIVVGALDKGIKYDNFWIAPYSNRTLEPEYEDLPKPLVVAPGYFEYYDQHKTVKKVDGTSFAAPMVSGAISVLLGNEKKIDLKNSRVAAIKAILAASSRLPKNISNLEYKLSGLEKTYGSGLIDYQRMKKAAFNLEIVNVSKGSIKEFIYTSNSIYLDKDENIKIASAWMNNGGVLKNKVSKPGFWKNLFGIDQNWENIHRNEYSLKYNENNSRQEKRFFTDFDLVLEKYDGNKWIEIKRVTSIKSNVEIINYKAIQSGKYRIRIFKYNDIFENSIDDVIGVTYVKN